MVSWQVGCTICFCVKVRWRTEAVCGQRRRAIRREIRTCIEGGSMLERCCGARKKGASWKVGSTRGSCDSAYRRSRCVVSEIETGRR